ncbi:Serine--tRNA ligase, mitochondrial [Golovinomyces cichoracearum]|uniref:serine--tRNA ligase n=1 Tax=Golovinomyces cichoracearum TaxID=62708 RepID=A0A420ILL8_9PEZI|nr:Serine--tRNA ligase, mitochondrial [Golovinomyces cichoracearum]
MCAATMRSSNRLLMPLHKDLHLRCRNKTLKRLLHRSYHASIRLRNDLHYPSIAPKVSIDTKHIRENVSLYEQNCLDRNYVTQAEYPAKICDLTKRWQSYQQSSRLMRERSNSLTRQLASKSKPSDADGADNEKMTREDILKEARSLKEELSVISQKQNIINTEIGLLAKDIPNLMSDETPRGTVPTVVGFINEHPDPDPNIQTRSWRSHVDIGQELKLIDFAGAATTSGWGWYYLLNEAAFLEQALVQFALSIARKRGWSLISPPSMVYSHIADSCGFLPRDQNGEQQVYQIQQCSEDIGRKPQRSLAGTAEIPLASMKANQTLEVENLPLKYIAVSRCYRAEAGARGADTKGLYRVHEFTKVEMFAFTMPNSAASMFIFDEILSIQCEILTALQLHCRILDMPSMDLGASATRKRDIEVFFPSRRARASGWGEVTSLSNCTDYQTRRLATRLRSPQSNHADQFLFPYTLNGTALAIPRVLAALLEYGWDEKRGVVVIPEALWPWMDGVRIIGKSKL